MNRSSPRATTHWHDCSPGKTTFLKYMLARLIVAGQVVVLCDSKINYLFFDDTVYSRPAEFGFDNLPRRIKTAYFPVWALIDVDYKEGEPSLANTNVWPIQASPPNPIRWKSWRKQNGAALLGMPLWTRKEPVEGYVFSLPPFLSCRSIGVCL